MQELINPTPAPSLAKQWRSSAAGTPPGRRTGGHPPSAPWHSAQPAPGRRAAARRPPPCPPALSRACPILRSCIPSWPCWASPWAQQATGGYRCAGCECPTMTRVQGGQRRWLSAASAGAGQRDAARALPPPPRIGWCRPARRRRCAAAAATAGRAPTTLPGRAGRRWCQRRVVPWPRTSAPARPVRTWRTCRLTTAGGSSGGSTPVGVHELLLVVPWRLLAVLPGCQSTQGTLPGQHTRCRCPASLDVLDRAPPLAPLPSPPAQTG